MLVLLMSSAVFSRGFALSSHFDSGEPTFLSISSEHCVRCFSPTGNNRYSVLIYHDFIIHIALDASK